MSALVPRVTDRGVCVCEKWVQFPLQKIPMIQCTRPHEQFYPKCSYSKIGPGIEKKALRRMQNTVIHFSFYTCHVKHQSLFRMHITELLRLNEPIDRGLPAETR